MAMRSRHARHSSAKRSTAAVKFLDQPFARALLRQPTFPLCRDTSNERFIQTPDYIVIATENIHDARIIPMDGRPHGSVRRWMGDSRGRWAGSSLEVETTRFSA